MQLRVVSPPEHAVHAPASHSLKEYTTHQGNVRALAFGVELPRNSGGNNHAAAPAPTALTILISAWRRLA